MYFTVYTIVFFHLLHQQQKQSVHRFFFNGENIYVNEMVKKVQHFPVSGAFIKVCQMDQ